MTETRVVSLAERPEGGKMRRAFAISLDQEADQRRWLARGGQK